MTDKTRPRTIHQDIPSVEKSNVSLEPDGHSKKNKKPEYGSKSNILPDKSSKPHKTQYKPRYSDSLYKTEMYADFISQQQAKLIGAGLAEARVEWLPTKVKPGNDGKVDTNDFEDVIKIPGEKQPQPKDHTECPKCDGTGKYKKFTGRVGQDRETGVVHAQYLNNEPCSQCRGVGHTPKNPPKTGQMFSSRFD